MNDLGIYARHEDDQIQHVNKLDDEKYRQLVQSLNKEQKEFFYHVLHMIKTNQQPLNLFLSGGAGVGKSRATNAIYETLIRFYDHQVGANPDQIKVLKVAPTGKAALNIGGNTIHSVLKIPANRGFAYCALDTNTLNAIRSKLRTLKVLLIDEISMVGSTMFNFINLRLQQLIGTIQLFGGISINANGDLFQPQPVFDKWIFENTTQAYGSLAPNLWQDNFKMFELTAIQTKKTTEVLHKYSIGFERQNVQLRISMS